MRRRFERYKLVLAYACSRGPALPIHPNLEIVGSPCGTAYACICHRGSVMRRQELYRPGSHDLHVLYVRYFDAVLPFLRPSSEHLNDTPRPLFVGGPCMSAASSYAGSRGVTMSFLPNTRRLCLAKHTNVLFVASLLYSLFRDHSADLIFTSPSVLQVSLASTSRPRYRFDPTLPD